MIRLDDRPLSNEIENLLLQLQDESLNFRHHVGERAESSDLVPHPPAELFVGESQDCLKYNLGSFFLRMLVLAAPSPLLTLLTSKACATTCWK
mmetsp:Transcript_4296/g.10421  ORF Transcript_4296/g.10421 Transcript_4296/m.10421 type:complete len:93 (+) Transcript_4296:238-516(+)